MTESARDIIMHDMKKGIVLDLLARGKRLDDRGPQDYRPISVKKGVLDTAEGSALARIGGTQILAAAKLAVATPFADRPKEGVFSTNCEFLPLANPNFEPGPPNEDSIELARVVDRGIRSAEVDVDDSMTSGFFLEEGKVLALYLDLYVLDHAGNMTDAAALAACAALAGTSVPKYEDGKLIYGENSGKLNLKRFPIATSLARVGKYLMADPTLEEATAADTRLTITTTQDGRVAAIQKGRGELSRDELFAGVDIAFKKGAELRKYALSP